LAVGFAEPGAHRQVVAAAGLDTACIMPQPVAAFGWAAVRPGFSVLGSRQGLLLPSIGSGLRRYLADERLQAAVPSD